MYATIITIEPHHTERSYKKGDCENKFCVYIRGTGITKREAAINYYCNRCNNHSKAVDKREELSEFAEEFVMKDLKIIKCSDITSRFLNLYYNNRRVTISNNTAHIHSCENISKIMTEQEITLLENDE